MFFMLLDIMEYIYSPVHMRNNYITLPQLFCVHLVDLIRASTIKGGAI